MKEVIPGVHHVTAIAGDPQQNLNFYAGTLGLRLVKQTINFDDPGTYHFYYGDEAGTPSTILTFFPWPGIRRGRAGTGQATSVAFSIPESSLGFWIEPTNQRTGETVGKEVMGKVHDAWPIMTSGLRVPTEWPPSKKKTHVA